MWDYILFWLSQKLADAIYLGALVGVALVVVAVVLLAEFVKYENKKRKWRLATKKDKA